MALKVPTSATPCHFYNWLSSFLRLSSCFIVTLMALDCVCATLHPIYYRTKVTCTSVAKVMFYVICSASIISALPAMGWAKCTATEEFVPLISGEVLLFLLPY